MSAPTHPPYAYMIRSAVEALGRNSDAKSISEYIKAKFSGLPLAHDQLILFYLNQLIESRELAFSSAPDRCFVILNSPSSSPPTLSARYLSPEDVVKYAIRSLNEEGGSTEKSICTNILANFGELPWAPRKFLFFFINRLVERGELGTGAGPGRYVLIPTSSGPKSPVAQEGPNKAEEEGKDKVESTDGGNGDGGGGGSVPKPKRGRGRPRKKRPNESESSQSGTAHEAQDAPRPTQPVRPPPQLNLGPNDSTDGSGGGGGSVPMPKRGRGRPRKERPNASESSQSGTAQEAQDALRPTQLVRQPPQLNLGPNEYILALPAVAAARVEVNPPRSSSVPANK